MQRMRHSPAQSCNLLFEAREAIANCLIDRHRFHTYPANYKICDGMRTKEHSIRYGLTSQVISSAKFGDLTLQSTPCVERGLPFISRFQVSMRNDD